MNFLKDVFQTADEIKRSQEKFKDAVDVSSRQAEALIRPYLNEAQNEILSEILEGLVASVAEHSFQIGQQRHADVCRSGGNNRGKVPCVTVK